MLSFGLGVGKTIYRRIKPVFRHSLHVGTAHIMRPNVALTARNVGLSIPDETSFNWSELNGWESTRVCSWSYVVPDFPDRCHHLALAG